MEKLLRKIEKFIPKKVYKLLQPIYHYILMLTGIIIYKFPGHSIHIIGITGTKGKSTTTEYVNAVLEAAGYSTAILSTIRFKIGETSKENKYKMTMPGRFFVSKFIHDAQKAGCQYAIIEMTSEGARFYRHRGIPIDTLIFTNLTPEHIDSHGSFENYLKAKLSIARAVERSSKGYKRIIVNKDDAHADNFLVYNVHEKIGYRLHDWDTKYKHINIKLPGEFNKMNALAAITLGESLHITESAIKKGIESVDVVRGRCEEIKYSDAVNGANESVIAVIDYAHTPDSLEKMYQLYTQKGKVIAVLGGTGGGRDTGKRKVMGALASKYAEKVFVTDEDPYDEDPIAIMNEVATGVEKSKVEIIPSRREAIHKAIETSLLLQKEIETKVAQKNNNSNETKSKYINKIYILITGKGTDPYIMRAHGEREIWDDAMVVREEIEKIKTSI